MLNVSRNIGKNKMVHVVNQPYQSPRQRVWVEIRKNSKSFTIAQVAENGNMKYESARSFIKSLEKAGVVRITKVTPLHHDNCIVKQRVYELVKDLGYNVPELTKTGEIVTTITGNKLMWNTLRITRHSFDADELARIASTEDVKIASNTADAYLRALHKAGYLSITKPSNTHGGKTKYRLIAGKNTGPFPPQLQRAKQIFDPNINQVVFSESPELEEELKHGTLLGTEQ
ncbi:hypothetical protein DX910_14495 [Acinetobacter haemolyticus]|nr:hypothetical protein DX910_14495 [Acinetobacter haemolyticus]